MTFLAGAASLVLLMGAPPMASKQSPKQSLKQSIKVADKFPTVGKRTVITLGIPADKITFIYQPDAPVARKVTLETNGRLEVDWTPEKAGVVTIKAGKASKDVSVRFDGTPIGGLIMMLLAGLVLFGGVAVCMTVLFKGERPTQE